MKWFLPLLAAFLLVGCTAQPSGESSESASEPGNSLEYHMQTAPQPDCPFLFAEENTPIYGIPFDSPENGTISNQLVQVFANVYGGECPDCGESGPWALILPSGTRPSLIKAWKPLQMPSIRPSRSFNRR